MAESLDIIQAVSNYVDKILAQIGGMKVLLMDDETTGMVSMVYTQSQILEKEVYLTRKLSDVQENMNHLKAVVFVRPTRANISALATELGKPSFGEYHIFFSNIVREDLLQQLASADVHEVVKQVQEMYADIYAATSSLYTVNVSQSLMLSRPMPRTSGAHQMYKGIFNRSVEGLAAALLSFKKRPGVIRFQKSSNAAQNFAREMQSLMEKQSGLFDFRQKKLSMLLVLDRRDDPVTPLLTQWTYQAMVHELLGIKNNRVDMSNTPGVKPDMETIVLSQTDTFFEKHVDSNFGDLCDAVKGLLDNYQKMTKSNKTISTIEDMQRFVESYPELKKVANNVSKHVALVSELSRLIAEHNLMKISLLEQELACSSDHSTQQDELKQLLNDPKTAKVDAIRLVLLYSLRYETFSGNKIAVFKNMLKEKCRVDDREVAIVDQLLRYAGAKHRGGDLYGDSTLLSKSIKMATRAVTSVANVYTQHKPVLAETLDLIAKGRLKESMFPYAQGAGSRDKPTEVFVFMLGGTTYEEAATVAEFNRQTHGIKVVLGGTCIHNSQSFLDEIRALEQHL